MDPNLFHIDWDRTTEVLVAIVILSFILERALSLVFEHRLFVQRYDQKGLKEFIAFAVALLVCWYWQFDAISMIILSEKTSLLGEAITAGVIAGGGKGSVKLFREVLGIRSRAYGEAEKTRATKPNDTAKGGNEKTPGQPG